MSTGVPIEQLAETGLQIAVATGIATSIVVMTSLAGRIADHVFSSETGCEHPETELIPGNCTYEEAYLRDHAITLATCRPYYPQCTDCGEINYETRYTAAGREHSLGETVWTTEIPYHEYSSYLDDHRREASEIVRNLNHDPAERNQ